MKAAEESKPEQRGNNTSTNKTTATDPKAEDWASRKCLVW